MRERPDIEAILKRAEVATPGPWIYRESYSDFHLYDVWTEDISDCIGSVCTDDEAAFIAAARTDVPALCHYIEYLEAQIPKPSPRLYAAEDAFFRANVKKWIEEGYKGFWVVIRGDEHWIFSDAEVAYRRALETWQSQEFLLRQITQQEEIVVMASRPTNSYWQDWDTPDGEGPPPPKKRCCGKMREMILTGYAEEREDGFYTDSPIGTDSVRIDECPHCKAVL